MRSVFTIPPHLPFADALARGLIDEADGDPLALAGGLVLLPTRRACRALRDAFLRQSAAEALLLPKIQPLGDVAVDELMLDGDLDLDLPPAIEPLRERLLLARLLARAGNPFHQALRLAGELQSLLGELETEQVPAAALDGVVPERFADHWQKTHAILNVLTTAWPKILEDEGAIGPAERRHRMLTALAARFERNPPVQRIVAAGTTGSIPATRKLLRVIAHLPHGAVVLPGLDRDLDEATCAALDSSHPQSGLQVLVDELGAGRHEIPDWPAAAQFGVGRHRAALFRQALRPTAAPEVRPRLDKEAIAGLELDEHPDLATEAKAIALRLRSVLETPRKTAALVTPDRQLARRVAVELKRWRIDVDDSAGTPLDQTPPGAFLLLTAHLLAEGITPVRLLSVLKHPLARLRTSPAEFRRQVRELECTCLRGPRIAGGLAGIASELQRLARATTSDEQISRLERLKQLIERVASAGRTLETLAKPGDLDLPDLLEAHVTFAEALAADHRGVPSALWSGDDGESAASFMADLFESARAGIRLPRSAYAAALAELMAGRPIRPRHARHPRLFIWGQLEARLQRADLMILGGLNEGNWPHAPDPGPWLNRAMRELLGLPPVERRIGLAAHDFVQAASAGEVVLTRSRKDAQGVPTVPSRWITRLQALLRATGRENALAPEQSLAALVARLDAPSGTPRRTQQPRPLPPPNARPRRLSISDIGQWMKDPYALYARRILALEPLEALEADPGAPERGTVIHEAIAEFTASLTDENPEDAIQILLHAGRRRFEIYAHKPQVRALWWPRFERLARWLVEREHERRGTIRALHAEIRGRLTFATTGGPFTLTARADRIERQGDGTLVIIDYKTGQVPKAEEVRRGLAPQLPLEVAIASAGGFDEVGAATTSSFAYWRLVGDEGCAEIKEPAKGDDPMALGAAARLGLEALVAHYDDPRTPYPARFRPPQATFRRDYDHLSRQGEWPS